MKKLILIILSTLIAPSAFAGATIKVSCQCSYYQDYLEEITLSYGESSNATEEDIKGCVINQGKVMYDNDPNTPSACWKAKMNAMYNCQKAVHDPNQLRLPQVMILEDHCYGEIEFEDKVVRNNPASAQ